MSEDKKGKSPPGQADQSMDRKQFLKTMAVGVGTVALGTAAGGTGIAAVQSQETTRRDIQGFIRTLLQHPERAKAFLDDPQGFAQEHGILLTQDQAQRVKKGVMEMQPRKMEPGKVQQQVQPGKLRADDCSWHNFPECDHVASAIDRKQQVILPPEQKMGPAGQKQIMPGQMKGKTQ